MRGFLEALINTGRVDLATQAAGIERTTAYYARKRDQLFADAWDEAKAIAFDKLEDEAYRRAYEGTDEPVFHQGKQVATIKKYSDVLLMFLMKGANPEKYRDNSRIELGGIKGQPLEVKDLTAEEKALKIMELLESADKRRMLTSGAEDEESIT